MRTRVKRALPKASTAETRMAEVVEVLHAGDHYRGRPDVRWRYHDGKFQVAALCSCGRWWGWTAEGRERELLELLSEGCPKCSS